MSSEKQIEFTKENIDTYLKEVAKEYRKQIGKNMPAEMILIGGASVLVNYLRVKSSEIVKWHDFQAHSKNGLVEGTVLMYYKCRKHKKCSKFVFNSHFRLQNLVPAC